MGRTSKKSQPKTEEKGLKEVVAKETGGVKTNGIKPETKDQPKLKVGQEISTTTLPDNIKKIMMLNPQYQQMYITPNGFVHPLGSPEYLRRGAKLYTNIYYKS